MGIIGQDCGGRVLIRRHGGDLAKLGEDQKEWDGPFPSEPVSPEILGFISAVHSLRHQPHLSLRLTACWAGVQLERPLATFLGLFKSLSLAHLPLPTGPELCHTSLGP